MDVRRVVAHGFGHRGAKGKRVERGGMRSPPATQRASAVLVGTPMAKVDLEASSRGTIARARLAERETKVRRSLRASAASPSKKVKGELGPQPPPPSSCVTAFGLPDSGPSRWVAGEKNVTHCHKTEMVFLS